jgi:hypothetical protein
MKRSRAKILSAKVTSLTIFGALAGICSGAVYLSVSRQAKENKLFKERSQIQVKMPQSMPALSQESVDIAMEAFAISLPRGVKHPKFLVSLEDRGLTTGGALEGQKEVFVGPAAFASWAVLGSTLGHEIEIHGKQSFLKILITDKLSDLSLSARTVVGRVLPAVKPSAKAQFDGDGTWKAERDAYQYEIRNAKRFGLSQEEEKSIFDVMSFYYPSKP